MDSNLLKRFLYIDSQISESSEIDEALADLFENMADVKPLEVNTAPIETALSSLGIDANAYTIPSGSRTAITFVSPDEFHQARQILHDLTNVNKLAEKGWVAIATGDRATANDLPEMTIYFTEIKVPDDFNKKLDDVPDLNDLLKQAREDDASDSGMYTSDGDKK